VQNNHVKERGLYYIKVPFCPDKLYGQDFDCGDAAETIVLDEVKEIIRENAYMTVPKPYRKKVGITRKITPENRLLVGWRYNP
jgi:hypothetical protein